MSEPSQPTNQAEKQQPSGKLMWINILFFGISFLLAITLVPWYGFEYGFSGTAWAWAIGLWLFSSSSISMGYHRLWSHRAYEANIVVRVILVIGGCLALQHSALHWSSDHRRHHKDVDHDVDDPYSASLGFWHSHIGWLLFRRDNGRYDQDYKNSPDLQRDKVVVWQHKLYWPVSLALNILIPIALGLIYNEFWGMVLLAGVLRLVWSHHLTFFINSLAHILGTRPYTEENSARDSFILAVLTGGEGYHNYHHKFQYDYRNGVKWWHFDPSKWWIKSLSWVGLTKKLKVISKEKIEQAKAETLLLKAKSKASHLPNAEEVINKLHEEYDLLVVKLNELLEGQKQWLAATKSELAESYEKSALLGEYKQLKKSFELQRNSWFKLAKQYA